MDARDLVILFLRIVCFAGAALTAWELTVFLLTFRYRQELLHPDPAWRRASILSFVITFVVGAFTTLALTFIAVHVHRLFE